MSALTRLSELGEDEITVLQSGRNRVARTQIARPEGTLDAVVKTYGKQGALRDYLARHRKGSKAVRAFKNARLLQEAGIGTPPPVAVFERWRGNRLLESHYVSEFVPAMTTLRAELSKILWQTRDCVQLVALIEPVARAVRRMHDAGVVHHDLGNQNIGLQIASTGSWNVLFLDLNRARFSSSLTDAQRGKDLARLEIPSELFKEFLNIYGASLACRQAEAWERFFYGVHSALRLLRHPIRVTRLRKKEGRSLFFGLIEKRKWNREVWLWDERSSQAIPAFNVKDRRRLRPVANVTRSLREYLKHGWKIRAHYRRLLAESFSQRVAFAGKVGVALDPDPDSWAEQLRWLAHLQGSSRVPLLVRVYHHKGELHWRWTLARCRELHAGGHAVALALVQDRSAVSAPERWAEMLGTVFAATHDFVDFYEIGHATNRGKWGIWSFREYQALLAPALAATEIFPEIKLTGPACIDLDFHILPSLIGTIPPRRLYALSQHLYVDRRGAPENKQSGLDTVGKCALHRAFAKCYGFNDDRIIVSEVNWPILQTGPWSPVGSLFDPYGPHGGPSVTEDQQAQYLVRYFLETIASGHVSRVYWWRLAARGYGLIDDADPANWRARPSFFAMQKLLRELGGATFEKKLDAPTGTWRLEFSDAAGARIIAHWTSCSHVEFAKDQV
jgi:tRNA A-37 threonylcarbamoyl transferase component Bud32